MLFVNDDKTENNNYAALWPWSGSYCFQHTLHFCLSITDETKKVRLENIVGVVNRVLLIYSGICSDRSQALRKELTEVSVFWSHVMPPKCEIFMKCVIGSKTKSVHISFTCLFTHTISLPFFVYPDKASNLS